MKNPVLPGFYADPFVYRDHHDYYMVATKEDSADVCGTGSGGVFEIFHSVNLTDWSSATEILSLDDISWADDKAWAPAVTKYQDHWYLFFCGNQQIGVAVCDTPTGRYRDVLDKPLIPTRYLDAQAIDPSIFIDDDGKAYFLWGQGRLYLCEIHLSPTDVHLIGDPICVSDQFLIQRSIHPEKTDNTIYNEGADLTKVGDKYLLTWSVYDCRDYRYNIRYAWADKPTGFYIQPLTEGQDNLMIQRIPGIDATGHGNPVFYQGELYQFYHRFVSPRQGYHREICCDKVIIHGDCLRVIPTK